jgi:hypothetical protein
MNHSESLRAHARSPRIQARNGKPQRFQAIGGGVGGTGELDANAAVIFGAIAFIGSIDNDTACDGAMNAAQQPAQVVMPSWLPESGQHGIPARPLP